MGEHLICFRWNPIVPSIEKIREIHFNVFELTVDREFWTFSGSTLERFDRLSCDHLFKKRALCLFLKSANAILLNERIAEI